METRLLKPPLTATTKLKFCIIISIHGNTISRKQVSTRRIFAVRPLTTLPKTPYLQLWQNHLANLLDYETHCICVWIYNVYLHLVIKFSKVYLHTMYLLTYIYNIFTLSMNDENYYYNHKSLTYILGKLLHSSSAPKLMMHRGLA